MVTFFFNYGTVGRHRFPPPRDYDAVEILCSFYFYFPFLLGSTPALLGLLYATQSLRPPSHLLPPCIFRWAEAVFIQFHFIPLCLLLFFFSRYHCLRSLQSLYVPARLISPKAWRAFPFLRPNRHWVNINGCLPLFPFSSYSVYVYLSPTPHFLETPLTVTLLFCSYLIFSYLNSFLSFPFPFT